MKLYRRCLQKNDRQGQNQGDCVPYETRESEKQENCCRPQPEKSMRSGAKACVGCNTLKNQGPCQKCPGLRIGAGVHRTHEIVFLSGDNQPLRSWWALWLRASPPSLQRCGLRLAEVPQIAGSARRRSVSEVEATLDDFPAGAQQHQNDRYNASRRTRDYGERGGAVPGNRNPAKPLSKRNVYAFMTWIQKTTSPGMMLLTRAGVKAEGSGILMSHTQDPLSLLRRNQPAGHRPAHRRRWTEPDTLGLGRGLPHTGEAQEILIGGESFEDLLGPRTGRSAPATPDAHRIDSPRL